jgi:hypothetical protein
MKPWETPDGIACFERWIATQMAKLNAYRGDGEFNGRKPWTINKYGLLESLSPYGPRSVSAPDNFRDYNFNKYWYMWDHWIPGGPNLSWRWPPLNGAGVESIRFYIQRECPQFFA